MELEELEYVLILVSLRKTNVARAWKKRKQDKKCSRIDKELFGAGKYDEVLYDFTVEWQSISLLFL